MCPTNRRVVRKRLRRPFTSSYNPPRRSFLTSRLDNRPHRLVPRVGRVLREMGAHAGFEIAGRPDRLGVEAFEFGLERLLGRNAALEGGEGLRELSTGGTTLTTPWAVSLRSTKAMNWSEGSALSSTRSSPVRKAISSSVAPLILSRFAKALSLARRPTLSGSSPSSSMSVRRKPEINEVEFVPELVAFATFGQRFPDRESGDVEVVQDEQG